MKYLVSITEHGWGICDIPEHFFGCKTIYEEVFDTLEAAKNAACEKVKDLFDKYELCREWTVMARYGYWIRTKVGEEHGWNHQYEATIYDFTDEEYEEIAE